MYIFWKENNQQIWAMNQKLGNGTLSNIYHSSHLNPPNLQPPLTDFQTLRRQRGSQSWGHTEPCWQRQCQSTSVESLSPVMTNASMCYQATIDGSTEYSLEKTCWNLGHIGLSVGPFNVLYISLPALFISRPTLYFSGKAFSHMHFLNQDNLCTYFYQCTKYSFTLNLSYVDWTKLPNLLNSSSRNWVSYFNYHAQYIISRLNLANEQRTEMTVKARLSHDKQA